MGNFSRKQLHILSVAITNALANFHYFRSRNFRGFREFWPFSREFMTLKIWKARIRVSLCSRNHLISLIRESLCCSFLLSFQLGSWNNWLKTIIFCRKIITFSKLINYNFIFHCNWTFLFHCAEHLSNILLFWRLNFCSSFLCLDLLFLC